MSVNKASIKVRLDPPLKKKLEAVARSERRTVENQTVCLIENALRVFERGGDGNLFAGGRDGDSVQKELEMNSESRIPPFKFQI